MEQGKRKIAITGATGKREDHTIGNISLLIEYMRAGADVFSFTDHGIFIPCRDITTHKCRKGQQVSIFSITLVVDMNPFSIPASIALSTTSHIP